VKLPTPLAVPPAVVTATEPETAPGITIPTNVVALFETAIAETPPIVKDDGVVKLVPVIVTKVPTVPVAGVNDVIVGAGINVNPASEPVPKGVVILTSPELPAATTAVIVVAFTTVKEVAAVPPKLTAVASVKFVPVIVMEVPLFALIGVKLFIVGDSII
jgi:hypothetical protein